MVDLGLTHIHSLETDIQESASAPVPDNLEVHASGHAWLVGARYSHQF